MEHGKSAGRIFEPFRVYGHQLQLDSRVGLVFSIFCSPILRHLGYFWERFGHIYTDSGPFLLMKIPAAWENHLCLLSRMTR